MTKLEELSILIQRVKDFENVKAQAEKTLEDAERRIERLVENDIPNLMDALGMERIVTGDGEEIKVVDVYHTSIPDRNRHAAYKWLRDNGHGALIKNILQIQFEAGRDDEAAKVADGLAQKGLPVILKENIHAQTLKAFVREQMEQGVDIPEDVFGIYHKREAKMKRSEQ